MLRVVQDVARAQGEQVASRPRAQASRVRTRTPNEGVYHAAAVEGRDRTLALLGCETVAGLDSSYVNAGASTGIDAGRFARA